MGFVTAIAIGPSNAAALLAVERRKRPPSRPAARHIYGMGVLVHLMGLGLTRTDPTEPSLSVQCTLTPSFVPNRHFSVFTSQPYSVANPDRR